MGTDRIELCMESSTNGSDRTSTAPRLFLVGAERSGTTLLRLMLDHHPEIAFHFEFEFVVDLLAADPKMAWPDVSTYCNWLKRNRIFLQSNYELDPTLSYVELVDDFLQQQRRRSGDKHFVGATVHRDFDKLPWIWPNARYIHIVRDGRDVSRSVVGMGWAGNSYDAAEHWLEAQTTWRCLKRQLVPDQWIEVRYEDLVTNTTSVLREITEFVGVEYCDKMLEYPQDSTYDLPDAAMAYQWKRKFSNHELQLVEARLADELVRQGYELSDQPRIRVSTLRRLALQFHSRLARCRFRCHRYGPVLVAQDFLARRIGTSGFRQRVEQRIHDIDLQSIR